MHGLKSRNLQTWCPLVSLFLRIKVSSLERGIEISRISLAKQTGHLACLRSWFGPSITIELWNPFDEIILKRFFCFAENVRIDLKVAMKVLLCFRIANQISRSWVPWLCDRRMSAAIEFNIKVEVIVSSPSNRCAPLSRSLHENIDFIERVGSHQLRVLLLLFQIRCHSLSYTYTL